MTGTGLLVMLPSSLGRSLLSHWLTSISLGMVDTAHCQHASRDFLLDLLSSVEIQSERESCYSIDQWRWMLKRNVKCAALKYELSGLVDSTLLADYVQSQSASSFIKKVDICGNPATIQPLMDALAINMCSLTHLSVSTAARVNEGNVKPNAAFATIIHNSAQILIDLCVSFSIKWIPKELRIQLPALRKLKVTSCTDADLISICKAARNLTHIGMVNPLCTNVGLAAIGQHCHQLEDFEAYCAYSLTGADEGFTALAVGCPKLTRFSLRSCPDFNNISLTAVLTHCLQLKTLAVIENDNITDAPLVAHAHRIVNLQTLHLEWCDLVAGDCVLAVATYCTSLHTLDLSSTNVPHWTLAAIIPQLQHVRNLYLANCGVDDEILSLIAAHMLPLEDLDISMEGGSEYTCVGLIDISEKCENLKFLDLSGCDKTVVNELTISMWQKLRPGIEINAGEQDE